MMEESHIFVSGVVQGVGFRAAVKRHAIEHQIKGFVRNLSDGRVEICAQGSRSKIQAFLKTIEERPGAGSIDQFDIAERPVKEIFPSFEIWQDEKSRS